MSSFLYNPSVFYYNQPSTHPATGYSPSTQQVPNQRVTYRYHQEPLAQFKVFAFEKLNRDDWSNASSIYRFELYQNRSFGDFLNVLKNHGISSQSHKFYYLDDEQDLIVLSTENDFKYMLQIMKGKTIKVACEKIAVFSPQRSYQPRVASASGFRNLPFFMQPIFEKREEKEENLIEKALDSVFSGIFEERKKQEEQPQRIHCNFSGNPRVRTIRLSDLLKDAQKEESQKQEKKVEQKSFEDYLAELFGKKLAERRSEEKKQEEHVKEEEKSLPEEQPVNEPTTEETPELSEQEATEKPVLSTSQIISNYLLDNDEDDVITDEEEEEESDDQSSDISEPVNQSDVQYPTVESIPAEEPSSPTISSNEEQLQQQFEKELKLLSEMGFNDAIENLKLLNKYNGDIQRTVSELIYYY